MDAAKGLNKNATRMLTGFIMGTIAMGCIILGGIALFLLLAVVIYFASKEYVKILEHKGFYPSLKIILFSEAILAVITYFDRFYLLHLYCIFIGIVQRTSTLYRKCRNNYFRICLLRIFPATFATFA